MQYFQNCQTLDEAKKEYFRLAKIHHPDKGGDTAIFQEIVNQFEAFKPKSEKFKGESEQWNAKEYSAIIEELIKIPVIEVEICGSWIWIGGDSKPYKDLIKAVPVGDSYKRGFSGNKSMWYFSPTGYRKLSKKTIPIDAIRSYYGSERVAKRERQAVED